MIKLEVVMNHMCKKTSLSMFTDIVKKWNNFIHLVRNVMYQTVKYTDPLSSMALLTEVHGMLTISHTFPSVLLAKEQPSHKILTHLLPMLKSTQNSL
jgi:hypothetical protein